MIGDQNIVAATPTIDTASWLTDPNQEFVGGVPNASLLLLAAAAVIFLATPVGYYQVREKKTGKRLGPRMYHY